MTQSGNFHAEVLADSLSPDGARLTTVRLTYPRFIHSELMTHRVFSRNSASSRAIPVEKLIARVEQDPFIPTFNRRVKGMGVGEVLPSQDAARSAWLAGAQGAVHAAKRLVAIGVDKSRANRLLEPYLWHTVIVSSTEWDNFFSLRNHEAAQPEFQTVAKLLLEEMEASEPVEIQYGLWHLPLVSPHEKPGIGVKDDYLYWPHVSAGRCARVSYDRDREEEDADESYDRSANRLAPVGHLSPHEHPARPLEPSEGATFDTGNFRGWVQLRKLVPGEANFGGKPWTEL